MRHIPTAVTAQGVARHGQIRRAAPALNTPKGSVSVAQSGSSTFFLVHNRVKYFFWCPQGVVASCMTQLDLCSPLLQSNPRTSTSYPFQQEEIRSAVLRQAHLIHQQRWRAKRRLANPTMNSSDYDTSARQVLDVRGYVSRSRTRLPAVPFRARSQLRFRLLSLILHPDRTSSELLHTRTMARLAWTAVHTAATLLHANTVAPRLHIARSSSATRWDPVPSLWLVCLPPATPPHTGNRGAYSSEAPPRTPSPLFLALLATCRNCTYSDPPVSFQRDPLTDLEDPGTSSDDDVHMSPDVARAHLPHHAATSTNTSSRGLGPTMHYTDSRRWAVAIDANTGQSLAAGAASTHTDPLRPPLVISTSGVLNAFTNQPTDWYRGWNNPLC